jgi:hypothetical protein
MNATEKRLARHIESAEFYRARAAERGANVVDLQHFARKLAAAERAVERGYAMLERSPLDFS